MTVAGRLVCVCHPQLTVVNKYMSWISCTRHVCGSFFLSSFKLFSPQNISAYGPFFFKEGRKEGRVANEVTRGFVLLGL